MKQVWKTIGRKPEGLEAQPDFPEELRYVYNWYLEIRTDDKITFTEMQNWATLTQTTPKIWEVNLLKTLDRIYWRNISD